jgi:hypothetical protein
MTVADLQALPFDWTAYFAAFGTPPDDNVIAPDFVKQVEMLADTLPRAPGGTRPLAAPLSSPREASGRVLRTTLTGALQRPRKAARRYDHGEAPGRLRGRDVGTRASSGC